MSDNPISNSNETAKRSHADFDVEKMETIYRNKNTLSMSEEERKELKNGLKKTKTSVDKMSKAVEQKAKKQNAEKKSNQLFIMTTEFEQIVKRIYILNKLDEGFGIVKAKQLATEQARDAVDKLPIVDTEDKWICLLNKKIDEALASFKNKLKSVKRETQIQFIVYC